MSEHVVVVVKVSEHVAVIVKVSEHVVVVVKVFEHVDCQRVFINMTFYAFTKPHLSRLIISVILKA